MANFFKDNDDLQYYFDKGVDWDSLVRITEHEFADPVEFRFGVVVGGLLGSFAGYVKGWRETAIMSASFCSAIS